MITIINLQSPIKKKALIIVLNLIGAIALLWYLTHQYAFISTIDYKTDPNTELIVKSEIMHQMPIDSNWLVGLTIGFLFINWLVYKLWIRSKNWIYEPLLIFALTVGLSLTYYIHMTNQLVEQIENFKMDARKLEHGD